METQVQAQTIPKAFLLRRLHSLTGAWLAIFLIFHLFTNSQAALFIGDYGSGFIRAVSSIHDMPFLPVLELAFLAFPIVVHTIWGIKYLRSASYNSFGNTGHTPYLPEYSRNHGYTWQRITSWLLVVGILAHIIHMRFIEYPESAPKEQGRSYMVRITEDEGLHTLAARLGVQLYTENEINKLKNHSLNLEKQSDFQGILAEQSLQDRKEWEKAISKRPLRDGELMAVSDNFGTAELMMVRNTFKSPTMIALYSLLVIMTCFHAFNGLWTFMISWGVTLTQRSQYLMRLFSITLMVVVGGLGLSAIWMTYWINLKN